MTTTLSLGSDSGSRIVLPVVPVHGAPAPRFAPPEPSEQRSDIHTAGFPWPGEWTVERDEARQKSTVRWKGKDESTFPWGRESDYESLTYDADDAHPEKSAVQGEAQTIFSLKDRELQWRGHLSITTDQQNFFYKYTREVLKDGTLIKTKTWQDTIPRDHQ
jgi:hypothetical protein